MELKYEELLRDSKRKYNDELNDFEIRLSKEDGEFEERIDEEFLNDKEDLIKEADENIKELEKVNENVKSNWLNAIQIYKDIVKLDKELENYNKHIEEKKKQLDEINIEQKKIQDRFEQLSINNDTINATFNETEGMKTIKEEVHKLNLDLEDKKNDIIQLKHELNSLKRMNEIASKNLQENHKNGTSTELRNLNSRLSEIKHLIINKENPKPIPIQLNKKIPKDDARQLRDPFIIDEYSIKNEVNEKKRNGRKINEVKIFIEAEKSRLILQKKSLTNDYNTSIKLLRSNQSNIEEWNNELDKHQIDESHRPILGNLKVGLDSQVDVLKKQVNRIKYFH